MAFLTRVNATDGWIDVSKVDWFHVQVGNAILNADQLRELTEVLTTATKLIDGSIGR